jgi:hypothetical protein
MLLDREQLLEALRLLDQELGAVGIRGEVFVVGGAAQALAYDARRATVDVDAIFVPAAEVRKAAARVAERLHIEEDWLNDGVLGTDDPVATSRSRGRVTRSGATRSPLEDALVVARLARSDELPIGRPSIS